MKRLLSLLLFCPLLSLGQVADSSRIEQSITLSQLHHTYIVGFLSDLGTTDKINYLQQLRAQYDTADMNKSITVVVPSSLVYEAYMNMTVQPEGQTSEYNDQIKDSLMPQITNPWLGSKLQLIMQDNVTVREMRIQRAREFIMSINLYQQ